MKKSLMLAVLLVFSFVSISESRDFMRNSRLWFSPEAYAIVGKRYMGKPYDPSKIKGSEKYKRNNPPDQEENQKKDHQKKTKK